MKKEGKIKKLILLVMLLSMMSMVIYQKSQAATMFNNMYSTYTNAIIASDGTMTIYESYDGIPGVTTRGELTTYIEKRILGIFWKKVNNGQPNNQWVDTIYNYRYSGSHSHQLSSTGTYRATVIYKVYGTGGDPDELTSQVVVTY